MLAAKNGTTYIRVQGTHPALGCRAYCRDYDRKSTNGLSLQYGGKTLARRILSSNNFVSGALLVAVSHAHTQLYRAMALKQMACLTYGRPSYSNTAHRRVGDQLEQKKMQQLSKWKPARLRVRTATQIVAGCLKSNLSNVHGMRIATVA